jgi:hypothetical protein
MATLYENFQGGTVSNDPLTSGATTINSTAFQYLPTVAAPDVMYLTLDPEGVAGAPEIVKVTAHASSATSVTVVRAQQDTSARSHDLGTVWVHGLTEVDADGFLTSVSTADIVDGAVTGVKIAAEAIDSDHYVDGSIDEIHLAADAVTSSKIAADAVNTSHVSDFASVVNTALTSDQFTSNWTKVIQYDVVHGVCTFAVELTASGSPTVVTTGTTGITLPVTPAAGSVDQAWVFSGSVDVNGTGVLYQVLGRVYPGTANMRVFYLTTNNQMLPLSTVTPTVLGSGTVVTINGSYLVG